MVRLPIWFYVPAESLVTKLQVFSLLKWNIRTRYFIVHTKWCGGIAN